MIFKRQKFPIFVVVHPADLLAPVTCDTRYEWFCEPLVRATCTQIWRFYVLAHKKKFLVNVRELFFFNQYPKKNKQLDVANTHIQHFQTLYSLVGHAVNWILRYVIYNCFLYDKIIILLRLCYFYIQGEGH